MGQSRADRQNKSGGVRRPNQFHQRPNWAPDAPGAGDGDDGAGDGDDVDDEPDAAGDGDGDVPLLEAEPPEAPPPPEEEPPDEPVLPHATRRKRTPTTPLEGSAMRSNAQNDRSRWRWSPQHLC